MGAIRTSSRLNSPDLSRRQRTLVLIFGPPAVGKMAVGRELSRLTGIPLFHNHQSIEAVLPVFEFGSPPFNRLVGGFRDAVFTEVATSDLPGLIFTYVWTFGETGDLDFVRKVSGIFEAEGARTVFVELWAPTEIRLKRNRTEERLLAKPSKRDVDASNARLLAADERYRFTSDGNFPFPNHLRIDNSDVSARDAAQQIVDFFKIDTI